MLLKLAPLVTFGTAIIGVCTVLLDIVGKLT